MYEERFYRDQILSKFKIEVSFKESDLLICSDKEIAKEKAQGILVKCYEQIEEYITGNPLFLTSLSPLEIDQTAPPIIKEMLESSKVTGIGPFSAVAGAVAQYVGGELLNYCQELIVENGGDIFLKINEDKIIRVYLGQEFKINNLNLKIKKRSRAFGLASSSSSLGHSLNFGKADLVSVVAKNIIIADGFATAISNRIKKVKDVDKILAEAKDKLPIEGLLVAFGEKIFLWGDLEISS